MRVRRLFRHISIVFVCFAAGCTSLDRSAIPCDMPDDAGSGLDSVTVSESPSGVKDRVVSRPRTSSLT